MFNAIFQYELSYHLKRPTVYVFSVVTFLLTFLASTNDGIVIGGSNDAIYSNAPYVIMSISLLLTVIGIFMTTAIINNALIRDYDHQFDEILFTKPIGKSSFILGRYLAGVIICLLPFVGGTLGIFFASLMPFVDQSAFGPSIVSGYLASFFIGVVPNILFTSSIILLLASLFKSHLISFLGAIGTLILYIMTISISSSIEIENLAILLDPLAITSFELFTKYWTVDEKNTQIVSLTGAFLLNRIIWTSISILFISIAVYLFSFSRKKIGFKRKNNKDVTSQNNENMYHRSALLPSVRLNLKMNGHWKIFIHLVRNGIYGIVTSTPFIILMLLGVINMMASLPNVAMRYGTGNHPVTYLIVDSIRGSYYLTTLAILMYYSGLLIWKERDAKMDHFIDASPTPSWILLLSKITTMIAIMILMMSIAITSGISYQSIKGYTHFELGVYAKEFLVFDLITFIVFTILSMTIQTIVNNKYLGYFIFLIGAICLHFGPQALSIDSHLLTFASTPSYIYSDMNGFSFFEKGLFGFHTYWLLFSGFLIILSILFWNRGIKKSIKQRLQIAKANINKSIIITTSILSMVWLITTGFLFHQTNVINTIKSDKTTNQIKYHYEKNYKQYAKIAQPRNTDIAYNIDIFPSKRSFHLTADVQAINKTDKPINELHFTLQEDVNVDLTIKEAILTLDDKHKLYQIFTLKDPLLPGETFAYQVNVIYESQGIENEVSNLDIVPNGSFLSNFKLMPTFGYVDRIEISDKQEREDYDLPPLKDVNKLHATCSHSCQNHYISQDSDWVNVSSIVSTSIDQLAIAPGTLDSQWIENDRNYFSYTLDKPVINFYAFVSGKYEVSQQEWTSKKGKKVSCEVYYHKGHEYNVEKMMESIKHSLDYYTTHFSEYPHGEARIIEFPRYRSFAQAFPGTMPYSENMGFIANLNDPDAIDKTYYVVAHEMAHQWWAHQVIGAQVQGATMLSETFAQYSALMVMKEKYGEPKMKQFMKYEMDLYLRNRGSETKKEMPLRWNEGQDYIHYKKGSVVMYALQEYIGAENVNLALKNFVEANAYQEAPYATTNDVMSFFREYTPDSLQYILTDMFEDIILYSNKTKDADYQKLSNGNYEVKVTFEIEKIRADSIGHEVTIPHNDYIDIVIYGDDDNQILDNPIYKKRVKMNTDIYSTTVILDQKPMAAGIDPNHLLIDRFPEDNVMYFKE